MSSYLRNASKERAKGNKEWIVKTFDVEDALKKAKKKIQTILYVDLSFCKKLFNLVGTEVSMKKRFGLCFSRIMKNEFLYIYMIYIFIYFLNQSLFIFNGSYGTVNFTKSDMRRLENNDSFLSDIDLEFYYS